VSDSQGICFRFNYKLWN